MTLDGINYWAILVAFIVYTALAAIWFGPKTFYPVWLKSKNAPMPEPNNTFSFAAYLFGNTFFATAVQMFTLAAILNSLQHGGFTFSVLQGAEFGFIVGFGIAALNSLPHRLFSMEKLKTWLIECGSDVLNYTIAGAILVAMS